MGSSAAIPMVMQGVSMVAQTVQANQQEAQQQSQLDLQNQMLEQQQAQQAQEQRDLLKRQAASARAALAAGVGGGTGGSATALLAGLTRQTEEGIATGNNNLLLRKQMLANQDSDTSSGLDGLNSAFSVFRSFYSGGSN